MDPLFELLKGLGADLGRQFVPAAELPLRTIGARGLLQARMDPALAVLGLQGQGPETALVEAQVLQWHAAVLAAGSDVAALARAVDAAVADGRETLVAAQFSYADVVVFARLVGLVGVPAGVARWRDAVAARCKPAGLLAARARALEERQTASLAAVEALRAALHAEDGEAACAPASKVPPAVHLGVDAPPETDIQKAQVALQGSPGLESLRILKVREDYYEWTYEERRDCLSGDSINQLCKTLVVESKKTTATDCSDAKNSRFYAVIVPYVGPKLSTSKLAKAIRALNPDLSGKLFHMHMARNEVAAELTGFLFNGMTPFSSKTKIPVVLCKEVAAMDYIYLGAGEPDLKLGVSTKELAAYFDALILDVAG